MIKKLLRAYIIANTIGYTIYKLRLDERLIRAIQPAYTELVQSLKEQ